MRVSTQLPVLDAPPYRLRAFATGDLELVREASSDLYIPQISTVPAVFTRETGLAFIARQTDRVQSGVGYPFAIARLVDDVAVGHVGVWPRPTDRERASVGYWVAPSARGRGAAGRAVQALCEWAFRWLGVQRLEAYVEPWNVASQRTVEAAGFVREGTMRSWQKVGTERKDMHMYALLARDSTLSS
ncbi:MAG: GNAT family N-acetyltransferase [Gaiellales bacterium]